MLSLLARQARLIQILNLGFPLGEVNWTVKLAGLVGVGDFARRADHAGGSPSRVAAHFVVVVELERLAHFGWSSE